MRKLDIAKRMVEIVTNEEGKQLESFRIVKWYVTGFNGNIRAASTVSAKYSKEELQEALVDFENEKTKTDKEEKGDGTSMKVDQLEVAVENGLFIKKSISEVVVGDIIIVPIATGIAKVTNVIHSEFLFSQVFVKRLSDDVNVTLEIDPADDAYVAILRNHNITPLKTIKKGDIISFNLDGSHRGAVTSIHRHNDSRGLWIEWYDEELGDTRSRGFAKGTEPVWLFTKPYVKPAPQKSFREELEELIAKHAVRHEETEFGYVADFGDEVLQLDLIDESNEIDEFKEGEE